MTETHTDALSSYPPSEDFAAQANAGGELYREAEQDRLAFWAKQANRLSWSTPFDQVLDWSNAPFAKWFTGGTLNVAYNCVDRHVEAGNGDRVAIHWEGERVGENRTLTYSDLQDEVCKAANALSDLGLVAGDRVAIYMPMIPEAVIAMLACARLGVMHSVVFAGFTATALRARIADADREETPHTPRRRPHAGTAHCARRLRRFDELLEMAGPRGPPHWRARCVAKTVRVCSVYYFRIFKNMIIFDIYFSSKNIFHFWICFHFIYYFNN